MGFDNRKKNHFNGGRIVAGVALNGRGDWGWGLCVRGIMSVCLSVCCCIWGEIGGGRGEVEWLKRGSLCLFYCT